MVFTYYQIGVVFYDVITVRAKSLVSHSANEDQLGSPVRYEYNVARRDVPGQHFTYCM